MGYKVKDESLNFVLEWMRRCTVRDACFFERHLQQTRKDGLRGSSRHLLLKSSFCIYAVRDNNTVLEGHTDKNVIFGGTILLQECLLLALEWVFEVSLSRASSLRCNISSALLSWKYPDPQSKDRKQKDYFVTETKKTLILWSKICTMHVKKKSPV